MALSANSNGPKIPLRQAWHDSGETFRSCLNFLETDQLIPSTLSPSQRLRFYQQEALKRDYRFRAAYLRERDHNKALDFLHKSLFSGLINYPDVPVRMLIKVRTLTGKEIELDIESDYKISQIKEKVEEKEGIPPVQQRLIFGGKQMIDDKTAQEYNLSGGSTLHLVLALRGGSS